MGAWKQSGDLFRKRLARSGWDRTLEAVQICQEIERLCPGTVHAVSYRNGVLKVKIEKEHLLQFKLVEGKVREDLSRFTRERNLPSVEVIRLT